MYALRVFLVVFVVMLALSVVIVVRGQGESPEETAVTATPTAAAAAMDQEEGAMEAMDDPVAVVDVVGLELGTHEPGWIRYFNSDAEGELILQVEDVTRFPWIAFNNGQNVIVVEDFDDPDFIARLIESMEIVYDEELVAGECDATILLSYRSTDLLCTPGTQALEIGNIFLALFHPDSEDQEVVAVTTTIYNFPVVTPPTALPAPVSDAERRCGPWAPGQWITAQEYESSGLTLTVNTDEVWGEITDYQCMTPETGSSYLKAYTIRDVGDDGGDDGDDGGGDGDDSGGNVDNGDNVEN